MLAALALLLASTCPLPAQPFPSFLLDSDPIIGSAAARYCENAVGAFGDSLGLVVWWDNDDHTKATRVTRDFVPIDTLPIDLSGPWRVSGMAPAVAVSHSGFLVVDESLVGTVVSLDGQVMARVLIEPAQYVFSMALVSDGTSYLVVWVDLSMDNWYLRYAQVASDGQVLARGRLLTLGEDYLLNGLDVAWSGDGYLVVWRRTYMPLNNQAVEGLVVRTPGIRPDTAVIKIWGCERTSVDSARVAYDGHNFVVAWSTLWGNGAVMAARVSPEGVVLDSEGITIADEAREPDIAAVDDTTLVVWMHDAGGARSVYARRLDGAGHVLDSAPFTVLPSCFSEHVSTFRCHGGFGVLANSTWDAGWPDVNHSIVGRRVLAQGRVLDTADVEFSFSGNRQKEGRVASCGTSFLAIWADRQADSVLTERVMGRRFDAEGNLLDSAPFPISPAYRNPVRTAVGYGGGCYLVAWEVKVVNDGLGDVYGARVSPEGRVLDTVPIFIDASVDTFGRPDIAYGDSFFMVALAKGSSLYVSRVLPNGTRLDSVPLHIGFHPALNHPAIASDGVNFLVAGYSRMLVRYWTVLLDGSGQVLDTNELGILRDMEPEATFGAGLYLVVDNHSGLVWRIDKQGNVLDHPPIGIPGSIVLGNRQAAVFDGTNFLLAGVSVHYARRPEVRGTRVSPDGTTPEPRLLDLADVGDAYLMENCAAAADSSGNVGIVCFSYESTSMSSRARAVTFPAVVGGLASAVGPTSRRLVSVSPNPAARRTRLTLSLPKPERVRIDLVDAAGSYRGVMAERPLAAGTHHVPLDLSCMPPGVYFVRAASGVGRQAPGVTKVIVTR